MNSVKFTCDVIVNTPDNPVNFEIIINNKNIFSTQTSKPHYSISHDIIIKDGISTYNSSEEEDYNIIANTINNNNIKHNHLYSTEVVSAFENAINVAADNQYNNIKFVMFGKTDKHTTTLNGVETSTQISIKNIKLDGIDITDLFCTDKPFSTYTHNNNGYSSEVVEVFDLVLGCNGVAEFEFFAPVSSWFIEHLMI